MVQALTAMQTQNQEFMREMAVISSTQMKEFMTNAMKELGAQKKTNHDENIKISRLSMMVLKRSTTSG